VRSSIRFFIVTLGSRPARTRLAPWWLIALPSIVWLGVARADEGVLSLIWDAPAQCPGTGYVEGSVRRFLDSPEPPLGDHEARPTTPDTPVSARAKVSRAGTGWRAELSAETRGTNPSKARRVFEGDSCTEVADATALVLALMVNPDKVATYHARARRPANPSALVVAPRAQRNPAPQEQEEEARALYGSASSFASADIGTTPTAGFGGGFAAGILFHRLRVELVGILEPHHSASVSTTPTLSGGGVGVDFRVVRSGERACFALLDGAFEIAPCAGVEIVWMTIRGFGIRQPGADDGTWGEVVAGGAVRWNFLPRMGLGVDGAAQIPMIRRTITIDRLGTVDRIPFATGRVTAGLHYRF
jgi:hypothetical protein